MNKSILESIKKAMKAEADSVAVYEGAMEKAEDKDVKDFFFDLADQERMHYNWLLSYYKDLKAGNASITDLSVDTAHGEVNHSILTPEFLRRIGTNPGLFSAISAAVLMELEASRYYEACSEETPLDGLADFFETLAEWEHRHYHDLLKIQEESERYYWEANSFEPF